MNNRKYAKCFMSHASPEEPSRSALSSRVIAPESELPFFLLRRTEPMTSPLRGVALFLSLVAVAFNLPVKVHAQVAPQSRTASPSVQPPIQFEVASIRPHRSSVDGPSNRQVLPGGRFVATATSIRTLIRVALGTDDERMSGAPGWIDSELFDIDAITADHAEVTTPEQFQQLILSLLQERLQFKFHREPKEGPVFWLELNKSGRPGPGLKPAAADAKPNMSTNSNGAKASMRVTNMSMADVAAALRRQAGRPVEDRTGLPGKYDFQIDWSPKDTPESNIPSLYAVLQDQLGLRLRPAKGTIEDIVIDRIERPSDN